jgi:hypothetical protein
MGYSSMTPSGQRRPPLGCAGSVADPRTTGAADLRELACAPIGIGTRAKRARVPLPNRRTTRAPAETGAGGSDDLRSATRWPGNSTDALHRDGYRLGRRARSASSRCYRRRTDHGPRFRGCGFNDPAARQRQGAITRTVHRSVPACASKSRLINLTFEFRRLNSGRGNQTSRSGPHKATGRVGLVCSKSGCASGGRHTRESASASIVSSFSRVPRACARAGVL